MDNRSQSNLQVLPERNLSQMVNTDIVFSLQTNFNLLRPARAEALKGISRSCRLFFNYSVSVSHISALLLLLDGEFRRFFSHISSRKWFLYVWRK